MKYVVLASILSGSTINPFDNKEARVYKEDREIIAMQNLRYAYESKNINLFNATLVDRTSKIQEVGKRNRWLEIMGLLYG